MTLDEPVKGMLYLPPAFFVCVIGFSQILVIPCAVYQSYLISSF